jgi:hypothetical protein
LVNGTFEGKSFAGWEDVNGYWSSSIHGPLPCGSYRGYWLQLDTVDGSGQNGWPGVGSEDWAWTDINPPLSATVLHLSWEEMHHIAQGLIRLRVLGYNGDLDDEWDILYEKQGVTGKTGKCGTTLPEKVSADILLSKEYPQFRIEVYGKINSTGDGLVWGNFVLTGE